MKHSAAYFSFDENCSSSGKREVERGYQGLEQGNPQHDSLSQVKKISNPEFLADTCNFFPLNKKSKELTWRSTYLYAKKVLVACENILGVLFFENISGYFNFFYNDGYFYS